MSTAEKKVLEFFEKNMIVFLYIFITVAALVLRYQFKDWESPDYIDYMGPWFQELKQEGGLRALGKVVGDYNVLYLFVMALLTYIPLEQIVLIKGMSVVMDLVGAFAGALLCRGTNRSINNMTSVMVYGIILMLPNVFINSAAWAQCDFIYTAFIMLSILFLFKDKFRWAMIFYGIAFAFKLQAIIFLPVLLVYYVSRKKYSILEFLWWPVTWFITSLPAIVMGRSIRSIIQVYTAQTNMYPWMTLNYPNIYQLFQKAGQEMEAYELFSDMAILLTLGILGIGCVYAVKKRMVFNREGLMGLSAWCAFTCVMFLPAMHERYGMLAEILIVCYAFMKKNIWGYIVAVLTNGISIILYVALMFSTIQLNFLLLAVFNVAAYALFTYLILRQGQETGEIKLDILPETPEAQA